MVTEDDKGMQSNVVTFRAQRTRAQPGKSVTGVRISRLKRHMMVHILSASSIAGNITPNNF